MSEQEMVSGRDHEYRVRVYYEDTDMAGIVYHANYLKFIERGRSDYVSCCGVDQSNLRDEFGVVFAVHKVEASFLLPARFDDRLIVRTSLKSASPVRFVFEQSVLHGKNVVFRALVVVATMSLEGKPTRLPAEFCRKLEI